MNAGAGTLFFSVFAFLLPLLCPLGGLAFSDPEIAQIQEGLRGKPVGERISVWAEKFLGTPYDTDPQGIYVTRAAIEADDQVDCMYLTFRSVELALSDTPEESRRLALEKRFHTLGRVRSGRVLNYEDRYQYGEEMIASGKWGKDITSSLGPTRRISGTRGRAFWEILPAEEIPRGMGGLEQGDLIFFIKDPKRRTVGESVGHIGIIQTAERNGGKTLFLIHAGGTKNRGGSVQKVLFREYVSRMPFIGIQVTRFQ